MVLENGADGIGLFRIEQLYLARELLPRRRSFSTTWKLCSDLSLTDR